jgi:hypothetical protein
MADRMHRNRRRHQLRIGRRTILDSVSAMPIVRAEMARLRLAPLSFQEILAHAALIPDRG